MTEDTVLLRVVEVVSLLRKQPLDAQTELPSLNQLRSELQKVYLAHETVPAPAGAEEVRDLVLDALYRYCRALDVLIVSIEECDPGHLRWVLSQAEAAADLLEEAEDAIDELWEELGESDASQPD